MSGSFYRFLHVLEWIQVYERGLRLVDTATRDRLNRFYHKKDSFRK